MSSDSVRAVGEYLTVGAGPSSWHWPLPKRDLLTIGRDPGCDLTLPGDDQVSRRHADLQRSGGQWWITDRSTNGSYVNGQRVGQQILTNGDRLTLGSSELTFHTGDEQLASETSAPPRPATEGGKTHHAVSGLGSKMAVTGVLQVLHLGLNSFLTFATDHASGPARWIISQSAVVVIAMVMTGAGAVAERKPAASGGDTAPQQAGRRTDRSGLVALLVVLLVVGAGGFAVTKGIRAAVDYGTGKQSGTDRLVSQVTKNTAGLTLTVVKVEDTSDFTRVEVTVRNNSTASVELPLFNNCVLSAAEGTTLQADVFKSQWPDSIAPGAFQRGTITFPGHLPDAATRASLSFSHVGFAAISVTGIRLKPTG